MSEEGMGNGKRTGFIHCGVVLHVGEVNVALPKKSA